MLIAPQPARWGRSQAAIYQDCAGRPAQACDCEYQWRTFRGPWQRVAPPRAPHFSCLPKNSKQKKAPRHPGLRFAQTSLLTGTVLLPNPLCRVENAACGFSTGQALADNAARLSSLRITFKHERTDSPVKRGSEIGVEGVESQGCDESCAGPGTAQRGGPLERRWTTAWMQEVERRRMPKPSERTRFAAQRRTGPDAGGAFSLLTFSLRKQTKRSEVTAAGWPEGRAKRVKESEVPCRALPVACAEESAAPPYRINTQTKDAPPTLSRKRGREQNSSEHPWPCPA